jgi:hypothetical protein
MRWCLAVKADDVEALLLLSQPLCYSVSNPTTGAGDQDRFFFRFTHLPIFSISH